jgi:hypothetical protein
VKFGGTVMRDDAKRLTDQALGRHSLRQSVRRWLAAPIFPDDEVKTHQASVLNFLLLVSLMTMLLLMALDLFTYPAPALIGVELCCIATLLASLQVMRRGYVQAVSIVMLATGLVALTLANVIFGTVRSPSATGYLLLIVISSLLFDTRGLAVTVVVSGLSVVGLLGAEAAGLLQPAARSAEGVEWLNLLIWMVAADSARLLALADEVDLAAPDVSRSLLTWVDAFDYTAILRAASDVHDQDKVSA